MIQQVLRRSLRFALGLGMCFSLASIAQEVDHDNDPLIEVGRFNGVQVRGVSVSEDGRLFVAAPRVRSGVPFSVAEVALDGSYKPYPDARWNRWNGRPQAQQFTSVTSVKAMGRSLFVLDSGNYRGWGVVGYARIYEFDLDTNTLKNSWGLPSEIAPKNSYLSDLAVDGVGQKIYVSDAGLGGIIVVSMRAQTAMRRLDGHFSTRSEDTSIVVGGRQLLESGRPARIHVSGLVISETEQALYFRATTSRRLYSVPLSVIGNSLVSEAEVATRIFDNGEVPAAEGMWADRLGNIYMADLENDAIVYLTPEGDLKTLIQDARVSWASSFTIEESSGELIFAASRFHEASFNAPVNGQDFLLWSVALPAEIQEGLGSP